MSIDMLITAFGVIETFMEIEACYFWALKSLVAVEAR